MRRLGLIVLILCSQLVFAQSRYTKLVEKGKYGKVWKKVEKNLDKDPQDLEANYYAALITSIPESGKLYDPYQSYLYYATSFNHYILISDYRQLERLAKDPISLSTYSSLLDSILNNALQDVSKTKNIDAYERYLSHFQVPKLNANTEKVEGYIAIALNQRNQIAFDIAFSKQSIEALELFQKEYPDADQVNEAQLQIRVLAYNQAKELGTINSYKKFVADYPEAAQIPKAIYALEELEFEHYSKENSSKGWAQYLQDYPASRYRESALKQFDWTQYNEVTSATNWYSYAEFIENYPNNRYRQNAAEALEESVEQVENLSALNYAVVSLGLRTPAIVKRHYELWSNDGEIISLKKYYAQFPELIDSNQFAIDYSIAQLAENFNLHLPYRPERERELLTYVQLYPNKELSFVIMQRLLSPFINKKHYSGAVAYYNKNLAGLSLPPKFEELKELLSAPEDPSIKAESFSKYVNTKGNEYSPVLSADDKQLYYCATNQGAGNTSEDVYVSESSSSGRWSKGDDIASFSSSEYNEAPLAVSADGSTIILFRDGKLYGSKRELAGWSEPQPLSKEFNLGEWQGDASISSDGRAILFSAVIPEYTMNINEMEDVSYHGDRLYPTDLFVCVRDSNDQWSAPIHLGPEVNTQYGERYPFLHPDMTTLYFSSDGHPGLGKMDVFKSTRLSDSCWNCWSEPVNLGKEINTAESDAGYKVNTSGTEAYFTKTSASPKKASVLFVLDISGSMSGNKIEELKIASAAAAENAIMNNAEVSIASFDGTCDSPFTQYLPFTRDLNLIKEHISTLYAGGGTPMYAAYEVACTSLIDQGERNNEKVIVLMTDGEAQQCMDLNTMLSSLRAKRKLVKTQTIAYAVDSNSQAFYDLQAIANASGGSFFYASGTQDLGAAFERANSSLFQIVNNGVNKDIYKISLPAHLRPDFVAKIQGKLLTDDQEPVFANLSWEDLDKAEVIGTAQTNPETGEFFITLPMGKNYGFYVEDEAYFPLSQNIDLRDINEAVEIQQDIKVLSLDKMIDEEISAPLNNLFFEFSKSRLLSQSRQELKRVARIIKKYDLTTEISGHTDNVGTEKANQRLSESRANNVRDYLIKLGCDPDKLIAVGYGESMPVEDNGSEEGRSKNRRVEITFTSKE